MTDEDRALTLRTLLCSYAPDFQAELLAKKLHNGEQNTEARVKLMALALVDGLMFNNWPWRTQTFKVEP